MGALPYLVIQGRVSREIFPGGDTAAVLATGVTGEDNGRVAYILLDQIGCEHGIARLQPRGRCSPPRPDVAGMPRLRTMLDPWVLACHHCPVPADIDGCP